MIFFTHIKSLFVKDYDKIKTKLLALTNDAEALEKKYAADIDGYIKIITVANLKLDLLHAEQAAVSKLKTDLKAL